MPLPATHLCPVQGRDKMEPAMTWTVAALIERLAGLQYLRHKFYGVRPPDLSLRGAKRRGNLGKALPIRTG